MNANNVSVSDLILSVLSLLKVRYLFSVNGANIEHFIDSCANHDEYPQPILVKREDSASYAADFASRFESKIAVCCSTSGAGMLNLLPGIAESYSSMSSVLSIVGLPDSRLSGKGVFQDTSGIGRSPNALAMMTACSKYCAEISVCRDVIPCLKRAIASLLRGTPGPSTLLIHRDIFIENVIFDRDEWEAFIWSCGSTPSQDPSLYKKVNERISQFKQPAVIFGREAKYTLGADQVNRFLDDSGIPFILTIAARGLVRENKGNFLGILGFIGNIELLDYIKNHCDGLLCVGAELDLLTFIDFDEWDKVISVGEWGGGLSYGKHVESYPIPLTDFMTNLVVEKYFKQEIKELTVHNVSCDYDPKYDYISITNCINRHISYFSTVLYDAGNCASFVFYHLSKDNIANHYIALGMGGMGYSFSASIAIAAVAPSNTHLVIAGDGAFLMSGLEIHTVAQNGGNVLYMIFNDSAHGMCKTRQDLYFHSRYTCCEYSNVNFKLLADALSEKIFTARVNDLSQLDIAIRAYLKRGGVGVIDVVLENQLIPPLIPFKKEMMR